MLFEKARKGKHDWNFKRLLKKLIEKGDDTSMGAWEEWTHGL